MMRYRQQKIIEHVQKVGIVSFDELARMFNVSTFTIRRDVNYLSQTRLLVRVKGGAQRIETPSHFREARLPNRMQINLAQKEKIANAALQFIHPGDTIFLDGSSTIACLARTIAQAHRHLTIVTNSVLVTLELADCPDIRVIGLGGIFDRETFSFVGFDDNMPAESYHVDKAFFSCTGFIPELGTFENAAFNRNTKQLIAQHSGTVYLLIDSSKFGQRALSRVLDTAQINTIITEQLPDKRIALQLKSHNIDLIIAEKTRSSKS